MLPAAIPFIALKGLEGKATPQQIDVRRLGAPTVAEKQKSPPRPEPGGRNGGRMMLLIDSICPLPAFGLEGFDRVPGLLHRASHRWRIFMLAILSSATKTAGADVVEVIAPVALRQDVLFSRAATFYKNSCDGCGSHSGQIAVNVLKPDCQELT